MEKKNDYGLHGVNENNNKVEDFSDNDLDERFNGFKIEEADEKIEMDESGLVKVKLKMLGQISGDSISNPITRNSDDKLISNSKLSSESFKSHYEEVEIQLESEEKQSPSENVNSLQNNKKLFKKKGNILKKFNDLQKFSEKDFKGSSDFYSSTMKGDKFKKSELEELSPENRKKKKVRSRGGKFMRGLMNKLSKIREKYQRILEKKRKTNSTR